MHVSNPTIANLKIKLKRRHLQSVPLGHLGTRPRKCYVGLYLSRRQTVEKDFRNMGCQSGICRKLICVTKETLNMSQATQAAPETATETVVAPKPMRAGPMGPWAVIVHNDNINTFDFVIRCLREIARLEMNMAVTKTNEIHHEGASQVTHTHQKSTFRNQRRKKFSGSKNLRRFLSWSDHKCGIRGSRWLDFRCTNFFDCWQRDRRSNRRGFCGFIWSDLWRLLDRWRRQSLLCSNSLSKCQSCKIR